MPQMRGRERVAHLAVHAVFQRPGEDLAAGEVLVAVGVDPDRARRRAWRCPCRAPRTVASPPGSDNPHTAAAPARTPSRPQPGHLCPAAWPAAESPHSSPATSSRSAPPPWVGYSVRLHLALPSAARVNSDLPNGAVRPLRPCLLVRLHPGQRGRIGRRDNGAQGVNRLVLELLDGRNPFQLTVRRPSSGRSRPAHPPAPEHAGCAPADSAAR